MAFVIEQTITACFATSGNGNTLASWSPQADEVLLLEVVVRDETTVVDNVAGNGLTWTEVADVDNAREQMGVTLFRASSSSTPSVGAVSFDHDSGDPARAVLTRISGADISTTDGVEAVGTAAGPPVTDDTDMIVSVTTVTDEALALAFGGHRGGATFTPPSGETTIYSDTVDCGSGGDRVRAHYWRENGTVSPAGSTQLGDTGDLSGANPWAVIAVSIKPAPPVGDIEAALDIVVTVAADLDAQGKLDAALNLVLTQAADLTAAGKLDAALPIVLSVIADLKGAGELSAVQSIILTIAADLTAAGSLSAAALIALTVAADLDAEGEIRAALAIVLSVAADLDAPGSLSAALGIVLTVAADLTAAGELRAAANIILTVAANLTAPGVDDLQAALDIVLSVAADLDAVGQLTTNMQIVLSMAADLKAAGELRTALALVLTVAAGLTATGNLAASLLIRLTISADLQDTPPIPPAPPAEGGSPAEAAPPTVALTEQQVVQRQLLREDDEAMSVVLTALGLISK